MVARKEHNLDGRFGDILNIPWRKGRLLSMQVMGSKRGTVVAQKQHSQEFKVFCRYSNALLLATARDGGVNFAVSSEQQKLMLMRDNSEVSIDRGT
ncbi:hypothetical protein H6P81_009264 [Aristolochia fimbriata]|uniref:Uncharacterized protein n=1 Tax=Aristolochia fimbriata TaxID=158543 RepID=A0AAV7EKY0_ARIFI|nr:hypothetical protein H6P81_009264 [Aristolochia fimbriata]